MAEDAGSAARGVAEAKLALRIWGVEADIELHQKIVEAKAQARKIAPWAAGAAVLVGLLTGRGVKRGGVGGVVGTAQRGVGLAAAAVGIAKMAMPMVTEMMARRAAGRGGDGMTR